jgi:hypothetical protein
MAIALQHASKGNAPVVKANKKFFYAGHETRGK